MFIRSRRAFDTLTPPEVLALAISAEEEDARRYRDMAQRLAENYPASAHVFEGMASEEDDHRRRLITLFKEKFGDHIPLVQRGDVAGFIRFPPVWSRTSLTVGTVSQEAAAMEAEARNFYQRAAQRSTDPDVRKLLGDLAAMESAHEQAAERLEAKHLTPSARAEEADTQRRLFLLRVVQPGLAGLIDGSVSTIAPIFAAAFATQDSWNAFLVGLAASIGAGISMGLTEALSDDGAITGRGHPWVRGSVCGVMTTIGGLGHTLPYLIPDFWTATLVAAVVVAVELAAIAWVRWRYMETPFTSAIVQVVLGGTLVLLAGIFIGSS